MTRGEAMAISVALWLTALIIAGMVHIDQANGARSKLAVVDRTQSHVEAQAILTNQKTLLEHNGLPAVEAPPPPRVVKR